MICLFPVSSQGFPCVRPTVFCVLISSSERCTSHIGEAHHPPKDHFNLITSYRSLSPNTVIFQGTGVLGLHQRETIQPLGNASWHRNYHCSACKWGLLLLWVSSWRLLKLLTGHNTARWPLTSGWCLTSMDHSSILTFKSIYAFYPLKNNQIVLCKLNSHWPYDVLFIAGQDEWPSSLYCASILWEL